jgi:putative NADH-flavin reductase
MKIAVVAAAGKAGRKIVKEAKARGFEVTAFVRHEAEIEGADKIIIRDIFDLTKDDLMGFDAVVDAYGAWTEEGLKAHSTTQKHLCDILSGTDVRLLIVGGAGSLYVDPDHKMTVSDTPDFPESYKPVASAMGKALSELRERSDVKWTYVSPAGDFRPDEERTGNYILGGEELVLNERGESIIGYADYAVAMVDEIESGDHIQKRISVVRA